MPSLVGSKGPMIGLLLIVAYSSMVIDIIGIVKVRTGEDRRSPATIAMLVGAILQMLWCLYYFISSAKGVVFRASNVLAGVLLLFVWHIITTAITTAYYLQSKEGYCAVSALNYNDCTGVMKGVIGLGYSLVGLNLIYAGFLAALVSSTRASWSEEMYHIPARRAPNADMEKAPAH